MEKSVNVAVVGAGAAGLCALRLLARNENSTNTTFNPVAFEQSTHIGGTWHYTDCVGRDEHGLPVHSSMYKSLRTNLPKECMCYPDFSFPASLPSFVSHEDVQKYLEDYATHFDLWKLIQFKTIVEHIKPIPDKNNKFGMRWKLTTANVENRDDKQTEIYDAVLVCNGHYSKPLMPEIRGLDEFEGHIIHSHDYREPSAYRNKTVVVLGALSSGQDISVELCSVTTRVYLSHNKPKLSTYLPPNVVEKPGIKCCHNKVVEFHDGSALEVDAIILCTGYEYDFQFLDKDISLNVKDGRVSPIYKQLIPIGYPSLCVIGIQKVVMPLPLFHIQIQYFRSILDGTATLPSEKMMLADEEKEFKLMKEQGLPTRHVHILSVKQFDYFRELADLGHFSHLHPVHQKVYEATHVIRSANITTYRNLNFVITGENGEFDIVDGKRTLD